MVLGVLKVSEGVLTWSGKWAMSAAKFKDGDKCRFKYTFTGVDLNGDKVKSTPLSNTGAPPTLIQAYHIPYLHNMAGGAAK